MARSHLTPDPLQRATARRVNVSNEREGKVNALGTRPSQRLIPSAPPGLPLLFQGLGRIQRVKEAHGPLSLSARLPGEALTPMGAEFGEGRQFKGLL